MGKQIDIETAVSYCGGGRLYFSSNERRWITHIRKMQAQHPEQVVIIAQPEHNDGCIYASLPSRWLKLSPPRTMSEENRAASAERMRLFRRIGKIT